MMPSDPPLPSVSRARMALGGMGGLKGMEVALPFPLACPDHILSQTPPRSQLGIRRGSVSRVAWGLTGDHWGMHQDCTEF